MIGVVEAEFGSDVANFNALERSVGLEISNLDNEGVHSVVLAL